MSVTSLRYVIDASVAIKWLFDDEEHTEKAQAALLALRAGAISALAPDHINHEVANALRTGIRMRRLAAADAETTLQEFLSIGLSTVSGPELLLAGLEYALRFNCAYYDGLYLALADQADCPMLHADRRLRNILGGTFARELWIGDFPESAVTPEN